MKALLGQWDILLSTLGGRMSPVPAPRLICLPFIATYTNNHIKSCALDEGVPLLRAGSTALDIEHDLLAALCVPRA